MNARQGASALLLAAPLALWFLGRATLVLGRPATISCPVVAESLDVTSQTGPGCRACLVAFLLEDRRADVEWR